MEHNSSNSPTSAVYRIEEISKLKRRAAWKSRLETDNYHLKFEIDDKLFKHRRNLLKHATLKKVLFLERKRTLELLKALHEEKDNLDSTIETASGKQEEGGDGKIASLEEEQKARDEEEEDATLLFVFDNHGGSQGQNMMDCVDTNQGKTLRKDKNKREENLASSWQEPDERKDEETGEATEMANRDKEKNKTPCPFNTSVPITCRIAHLIEAMREAEEEAIQYRYRVVTDTAGLKGCNFADLNVDELALFSEALRLCKSSGTTPGENHNLARETFNRVLRICQVGNNLVLQGRCHTNLSVLFAREQDFEQAETHFRQGLQIFRTLGEKTLESRALSNGVYFCLRRGSFEEAMGLALRKASLNEKDEGESGRALQWFEKINAMIESCHADHLPTEKGHLAGLEPRAISADTAHGAMQRLMILQGNFLTYT
jgi:tetratricopeptide (TPR) repeat protein